jgi:hypothetical protein
MLEEFARREVSTSKAVTRTVQSLNSASKLEPGRWRSGAELTEQIGAALLDLLSNLFLNASALSNSK